MIFYNLILLCTFSPDAITGFVFLILVTQSIVHVQSGLAAFYLKLLNVIVFLCVNMATYGIIFKNIIFNS